MKIFRMARSSLNAGASTLLLQSLITFFFGVVLYIKPSLLIQAFVYLLGKRQLQDLLSQGDIYVDVESINLDDYIRSIALIVILLGGLSSAVFIIGMMVGSSHSITLTALYFVLTLAMLISVVVVATSFLWNKPAVKEILKPGLERSLENYVGDRSNESVSIAWNLVMLTLRCCGVNGFQDFQKLKRWQSMPNISEQTRPLLTPIVCCKQRVNISCAVKGFASEKNNWATRGCLNIITADVTSNLSVLMFLLLQFFMLLSTVFLAVFILTDLVIDSMTPL